MPFLVIAGITVPATAAKKNILQIGTSTRVFAGGLRSAIRAEKNEWFATTSLLTNAETNTLLAAIALRAQVTCSGDYLGGSFTCEVIADEIPYTPVNGGDALGFMTQLALAIRQV